MILEKIHLILCHMFYRGLEDCQQQNNVDLNSLHKLIIVKNI